MRAGIRFDGVKCFAVLVDNRGVVAHHDEWTVNGVDELEDALRWTAVESGGDLQSVTLDVGALLRPAHDGQVLAIRIGPRPPADDLHQLPVSPALTRAVGRTMHVTGGHDMHGRELAPLDLLSLEAAIRSGDPVPGVVAAITAVGSVASPEHERRVADLFLATFPDARVSLSHEFFSRALRDRDFTATYNAALLQAGDSLARRIDSAAARLLPDVPVAFGLNDGGRAPIRRLSATPVHAIHATAALNVQGVRHLAAVDDGDIVIVGDDSVAVGHVHRGVPATRPVARSGEAPGLASNVTRSDRYSQARFSALPVPAAVVDARSAPTAVTVGAPSPTHRAEVDMVALGAATAPLSVWSDSMRRATTAAQLRDVVRATEEDLRSQSINWGAAPDSTRVVESAAYTFAFGIRNVVRVRVRVIADWVGAPVPLGRLVG